MDSGDEVILLEQYGETKYYNKPHPIRLMKPRSMEALEKLVGEPIRSDNFKVKCCNYGPFCSNPDCYFGHPEPGSEAAHEFMREMWFIALKQMERNNRRRKK